jgi:3-methyl-2-oxobutanoate hydroxymethyltransferase
MLACIRRRTTMKNSTATFRKAKQDGTKLTMLTAYDYSTAKVMDQSGVNGILVGDSLGNVMLGYKDTLPVTMEDMIHHARAVSRAVESALLVVDMPFMSYQVSVEQAVANAGRLVQEGRAEAVKLEGGGEVAEQIRAITRAAIPVMAHIGLTPQSVNAFGGFKVQGKDEENARRILAEAEAVQAAGAFAVVLECIPAPLAALITERLSIPTIGIGAGKDCDGQVLVYQDMLGLYGEHSPKFVKRYAELGREMRRAFEEYIREVNAGVYPDKEHSYDLSQAIMETLR